MEKKPEEQVKKKGFLGKIKEATDDKEEQIQLLDKVINSVVNESLPHIPPDNRQEFMARITSCVSDFNSVKGQLKATKNNHL